MARQGGRTAFFELARFYLPASILSPALVRARSESALHGEKNGCAVVKNNPAAHGEEPPEVGE